MAGFGAFHPLTRVPSKVASAHIADPQSRQRELVFILVGRTCLDILPLRKIAPKCDLPHIPSKSPSHTFSSPTPGGLPAAPPCYSMRAPAKIPGTKSLPFVHSWPEIRICVKDIVS